VKRVRSLPPIARRPREAHKGDFGKVLVVGTSPGLVGAGCLAANAALRSGAGLVTLGVPRSIWPIAAAKLTSAMTLPLPETRDGALSPAAREPISKFLASADVLALGPGIGRARATGYLVRALVETATTPAVVDADGLFHLSSAKPRARAAPALVLTPHPGEMARLASLSSEDVAADREGVAAATARRWHAVVVLKGHRTVVTDGDRVYVNTTGNPGMATGGTGDVLTGVVAALLGQRLLGFDAFEAAMVAVCAHGFAGDLACATQGEMGMTAEDLLDRLPAAFRSSKLFRFREARRRN
jgi:ADP-dependent NAD(P)H-hydrate dehydratase / NAD(P)H-hydrate epimerase